MQEKDKAESDSIRGPVTGSLGDAGPYLTLGLELGFTMIAWSVIGYLLDRWLDTLPWLTLAGVLVGMVSLFIQLARAAKRSTIQKKRGGKPEEKRED
jgi:F0F1-type ATP synthase assembly protein I